MAGRFSGPRRFPSSPEPTGGIAPLVLPHSACYECPDNSDYVDCVPAAICGCCVFWREKRKWTPALPMDWVQPLDDRIERKFNQVERLLVASNLGRILPTVFGTSSRTLIYWK